MTKHVLEELLETKGTAVVTTWRKSGGMGHSSSFSSTLSASDIPETRQVLNEREFPSLTPVFTTVGMSGTKFLLSTSLSSLGNKCMIQRKWLRHTQNELNSFLPAFLFPTSYLLSHSLDCLGRQVLKATFWDTAITFQSGVHSKDKSPSKLKTDWWVAI